MPHLIRCPSCGQGVSTDAPRCPHCGRDIQQYLSQWEERILHEGKFWKAAGPALGSILGIIVLAIVLVSFSMFCSSTAADAWSMHELFSDSSWGGTYDGHYKISAIVWTIVSVPSWCSTIAVIVILCRRYIKKAKQQHIWKSVKEEHKVSLPFPELERIVNGNVDNWRILLENINCVYSILDKSNGKMYIGSTYGENGTWNRWSTYVRTSGHGNDQELKKLIDRQPDCAKNFVFSIIEAFLNKDDNSPYIRERETYWKRVFQTEQFGYNRN